MPGIMRSVTSTPTSGRRRSSSAAVPSDAVRVIAALVLEDARDGVEVGAVVVDDEEGGGHLESGSVPQSERKPWRAARSKGDFAPEGRSNPRPRAYSRVFVRGGFLPGARVPCDSATATSSPEHCRCRASSFPPFFLAVVLALACDSGPPGLAAADRQLFPDALDAVDVCLKPDGTAAFSGKFVQEGGLTFPRPRTGALARRGHLPAPHRCRLGGRLHAPRTRGWATSGTSRSPGITAYTVALVGRLAGSGCRRGRGARVHGRPVARRRAPA